MSIATALAADHGTAPRRRFRLKKDLVLAGAEFKHAGKLSIRFADAVELLVPITPDATGFLLVDLGDVLASPEVFEEIE
jgi:hypothetical protein